MLNGMPGLITPQSEMQNKVLQLLGELKRTVPMGVMTFVVRVADPNSEIPAGVMLVSEEQDTTQLFNAITHAIAERDKQKLHV